MTRQALSATIDGVSTNLYAYDVFGNMTNEVQNGSVIARDYDAFGRPTGYALGSGGAGGSPAAPLSSVTYAYDSLGRFASVTFGTNVFEYSRLPGTDLVTGYTSGSFSRSVSYEPHRDLISAVTNAFNGSTPSTISTISTFDYANDAAGRRISRLDIFDGTVITNLFGYNTRSEVTSALMGTNTYGYAYDPIGNRIESYHNAETNSYTANNLNQYTSIDTAEPTYDADGNMTSDGRGWRYSWNGENRMVCASNADVVVTYAYDHRGRMVRKEIKHRDSETRSISYTWDGWNIIREALFTHNSSLFTDNIWGLDIDGTLQGAGGVGGLLAVVRDDDVFFPAYDANGNITEYVSTNGEIVAHYNYSPFGETSVISGAIADTFTHRFSTKPWCADTGFNEYVYRKYQSEVGRWMNRDPVSEPGFRKVLSQDKNEAMNWLTTNHELDGLLRFINNRPLVETDPLGLEMLANGCSCYDNRPIMVRECVKGSMCPGGTCITRAFIGKAGPIPFVYADCYCCQPIADYYVARGYSFWKRCTKWRLQWCTHANGKRRFINHGQVGKWGCCDDSQVYLRLDWSQEWSNTN